MNNGKTQKTRSALLRKTEHTIVLTFIGLIAGILYAFGGATHELLTGTLNSGIALVFLALIGMPIVFAVYGFVAGAIGAFPYSFAAKWVGGIEMDLEQEV